jgi:hypothetical protein
MIEQNRILEAKFGDLHQPLPLIAIEDLALPVYKLTLDCVGEIRKDLEPTTEYLLQFLDLGIDSIEDLAGVMGLKTDLVLDLILAECEKGNMALISENKRIAMTMSGKSLLTSMKYSIGANFERSQIFDAHLWKIQDWSPSEFLTEKQMDNLLTTAPVRVSKSKKTRVEVDDVSLVLLNRILSQDIRELKEIHLLKRIQRRMNGFKLAKLLVYFDGVSESAFAIVIDGKRSVEHEEFLQSIGGLKALEIELEPLSKEELNQFQSVTVNNIDLTSSLKKEARIVKPYDHAEYFMQALEDSKKKLVIISPWIGRNSGQEFRTKLEALLKKNVQVLIAFGYEATKQVKKSNNSPDDIRALLSLSEKYSNFNFRKFNNDNHGKILIFDETIIIGSFNWLSFGGRPDERTKKLRGEYSFATSNSAIAPSMIAYFEEEAMQISSKMTEELVPPYSLDDIAFRERRSLQKAQSQRPQR